MSSTTTPSDSPAVVPTTAEPHPLDALIDGLEAMLQSTETEATSQGVAETPQALVPMFVFEMAGARFALPMSFVVEVQRLPTWTRLPNVPHWVIGAANLRGDIVSVVDPVRFLQLPEQPGSHEQSRKLIVIRSFVQDLQIGMSVERVFGMRTIPADVVKPPTNRLSDAVVTYLSGMCEIDAEMVLILKAEELMKEMADPFGNRVATGWRT